MCGMFKEHRYKKLNKKKKVYNQSSFFGVQISCKVFQIICFVTTWYEASNVRCARGMIGPLDESSPGWLVPWSNYPLRNPRGPTVGPLFLGTSCHVHNQWIYIIMSLTQKTGSNFFRNYFMFLWRFLFIFRRSTLMAMVMEIYRLTPLLYPLTFSWTESL